ncbi:hypothetical protein EGT74_06385 [Chitinophaga lutea]|uniref:Uncharacterized protein n=1 Tax=Chitinophaga lutea TaxID=2488634 RepID=A0A3N4QN74_9BACT|nr:hypothetical protein [Chitinophaga lutea]RPE13154.1 hypothetical protein EGT74_06385 [Chitinophaga lutea]
MYFILKFSETWSLYDVDHSSSRTLDAAETDLLKKIFPALNNGKILTALQVSPISPNKLMGLPIAEKPVAKPTMQLSTPPRN